MFAWYLHCATQLGESKVLDSLLWHQSLGESQPWPYLVNVLNPSLKALSIELRDSSQQLAEGSNTTKNV